MTAEANRHPQGTVYMLHFDQPYKHARHYVGWAADLAERLAEHAAGRGARLTQVVRDAGISWQLSRTWPGSRATERDIKDRRNTPAMCPVCSPHPWPGTGHRKPAADLAARREAAAFWPVSDLRSPGRRR
jgi:predicted GIY-YIG superfamily endonuclease